MSGVYVCPICGKSTNKAIEAAPKGQQHRCKKSTLQRIDSAMKTDRCEDYHEPTIGTRLEVGFKMLTGQAF